MKNRALEFALRITVLTTIFIFVGIEAADYVTVLLEPMRGLLN